MAYSSISATPPLVSIELGELVARPSSGPIGIMPSYPVQKAMTPNMLMPDPTINVCALLIDSVEVARIGRVDSLTRPFPGKK